ncbi:MAG: hypothetical protein ACLP19_18040 [Xanthobacteraceae bacterium]
MARAPRQNVTIHYRRLEDATGAFGKKTLQAAIKKAMAHAIEGEKLSDHWTLRAWGVPPEAEDTILMNLHDDHRDYFFGDLTHYTKGYMQTLLAQAADAPMLPVEQQPPPKGKEYVHSMMYWLAVKNHLLMIQSRSLGSKQLEEYLSWLVKDRTGTVGETGHVILQSKFDPAEVGGSLDDLQEIVVGGRAPTAAEIAAKAPAPEAPPPGSAESYHKIGTRKPLWGRAMDVLRAAMSNEADVQKLLESVPPEAELDVSVHIGYKARKAHISRAPMQEALRNLPEGEIRARGPGGRMSGNDIRLSHPTSILKTGNLLDPQDTVRALREAYRHFVDNGKIDADS